MFIVFLLLFVALPALLANIGLEVYRKKVVNVTDAIGFVLCLVISMAVLGLVYPLIFKGIKVIDIVLISVFVAGMACDFNILSRLRKFLFSLFKKEK